MIITLVGYMGSGKSSVAKELASQLNLPNIDLDKEIEQKEGQSISALFQSKGELYFRKTERKVLQHVLSENTNGILSVGGGTPVFYDNMEQLNRHAITFYLQANPMTLTQRLIPQKSTRPLIAHLPDEDLTEFVAKHLFERGMFYQKAQHKIVTDNLSPKQVTEKIIALIQNQNHP